MSKRLYLITCFIIFISMAFGCSLSDRNDTDTKADLAKEGSSKNTSETITPTPKNRAYVIPRTSNPVSSSPDAENRTIDSGSKTITLSFAGDVLLDGHVGRLIEQKGAKYISSDVKEALNDSDIFMVNLENPISTRGIQENDKQYTFRATPSSVNVLTESRINMVTLANNHILDFGPDALIDTFSYLKAKDIRYTGAGNNIDEASAPVYVDIKGSKIAFIASSHVIPFVSWHAGPKKPGVASTYDPTRILSEIQKANVSADIVVAYIHWGEEMNPKPVSYQKNLAKMYIDKGADIVIGSHPHILQGLEYYKDKIIAYSLGNFIFTNSKRDTMIINVELKDKLISSVRIIPCEINNFRPTVIKEKNRLQSFFENLKSMSFSIDIDNDGNVKPKK